MVIYFPRGASRQTDIDVSFLMSPPIFVPDAPDTRSGALEFPAFLGRHENCSCRVPDRPRNQNVKGCVEVCSMRQGAFTTTGVEE